MREKKTLPVLPFVPKLIISKEMKSYLESAHDDKIYYDAIVNLNQYGVSFS